jgi:hypothetical protein
VGDGQAGSSPGQGSGSGTLRAARRGRGCTAKTGNLRKAQGPVIERSMRFCNRSQMWSRNGMQADPTACGMR